MASRRFSKGCCYFLVGYLDARFKYPFVDTYVFIGQENDSQDKPHWIFQDVHSFVKYGERRNAAENEDIEVLELDEEGLETILGPDDLSVEFERLGV